MGVRWLADTNMVAVCWKLLVPAVTVVALIATSAHTENFSAHGGFMPFGWKGVFLALSSGGVIFAGLGFEQAVQLGGETRNPRRNIPFAIIGGMTVAIVLYIALQVAFILALDPSELSKGWGAVSFSGRTFGPFAALATALGLGWLAVLLYTDAIVSPGGTGLIYTGASARLTFALARNGFIPSAFARLSPRGTPFFAIAFSFLCGLVILLPFPGWQQLVGFISAAAVAVYAMAPLALGALRRQDPERPRPFRLPAASLLAPATFVAASEILLFTGWAVVWKLIAAILIGFALLAVSTATDSTARNLSLDWRSAAWLWPYLLGMGAISYFSSFDTRTPSSVPLLGLHGPRNELTFGWDILAVALLSLVIYAFAILSRLPAEQALDYIGDPTVEEPEGIDARGPTSASQLTKAAFAPPRRSARERAVNINPAAASSAAPNRLNPIPAHSAAGTLTPTPIVAATLREPSAFITTIDHLPERSFQDSGLLAPDSAAAQNSSRAGRPGSTVPAWST